MDFPVPASLGVTVHASSHLAKLGSPVDTETSPSQVIEKGKILSAKTELLYFIIQEMAYFSDIWGELMANGIFHRLPAFETGPILLSMYSCLEKWHSDVSATVISSVSQYSP